MKALFISRFDSYTKAALIVAAEFEKHGIETSKVYLISKSTRQGVPSSFIDKGFTEITSSALIKSDLLFSYDIVAIYDTGGMVRRICWAIAKRFNGKETNKRPFIVTGNPGILFSDIETGFSNRSMADAVFMSNMHEYLLYQNFCIKNNISFNGYLWGFNFKKFKKINGSKEIILFADQNVIPKDLSDRRYVAKSIVELAKSRPNAEVILKTRDGHKYSTSLFKAKWSMASLVQDFCEEGFPSNFKIESGDLGTWLSKATLLVTISSTAAIEALQGGVPIAIISDMGICSRNGTSYFEDSNCLATFNQLCKGYIPAVKQEWFDIYASDKTDRQKIIQNIVEEIGTRNYLRRNICNGLYDLSYFEFLYESKNKITFYSRLKTKIKDIIGA